MIYDIKAKLSRVLCVLKLENGLTTLIGNTRKKT